MNLTEFRQGMSRWLEIVQTQRWEFPLERYNTETVAWVVPVQTVMSQIELLNAAKVARWYLDEPNAITIERVKELLDDAIAKATVQ